MSPIQRLVALCCRHVLLTIGLCMVLTAGAAVYVANNFAMNTDSSQLIDAKVAWRMRQARFDAAFPGQTNLILVVIDGKTPELAEPGLMSNSSCVPAVVPSVTQSSLPCTPSSALNRSRPLRGVKLDGCEPTPAMPGGSLGLMSFTITVPPLVPSVFHNSRACTASLAEKNTPLVPKPVNWRGVELPPISPVTDRSKRPHSNATRSACRNCWHASKRHPTTPQPSRCGWCRYRGEIAGASQRRGPSGILWRFLRRAAGSLYWAPSLEGFLLAASV